MQKPINKERVEIVFRAFTPKGLQWEASACSELDSGLCSVFSFNTIGVVV